MDPSAETEVEGGGEMGRICVKERWRGEVDMLERGGGMGEREVTRRQPLLNQIEVYFRLWCIQHHQMVNPMVIFSLPVLATNGWSITTGSFGTGGDSLLVKVFSVVVRCFHHFYNLPS